MTLEHDIQAITDTGRAICTDPPQLLAPAALYTILATLKDGYGHIASEALTRIARAAAEAPQQLELTNDNGRAHPELEIRDAVTLIQQASMKAAEIGDLLDAAQNVIAGTGHRPGP
ncbi:hypothetical protein [Cumulibacter manganitolerans]|uniref:hypothetical protein n=1 Tax=Cumulibacter manganitolerans TaxID=1884992 RepID=UPI00129500FF|nr:hypothetical protein [Cumulibacter manganitolerans]